MNKEKANFVNLVATNLFEKAKLVEKTPIMLHRRFHLTNKKDDSVNQRCRLMDTGELAPTNHLLLF